MSAVGLFMWGWCLAAAAMAAAWWVQRRLRDAGVVDVAWAAGMGVLALFYGVVAEGDPARRTLVAVLAMLWSMRLAGHLLFDRVLGKTEDGRYRRLRAHWDERAQLGFFFFFQAQALATAVFSVPFLVVATAASPVPSLAAATAVVVWLAAVGGETVADRQLAAWRADPANRGRTCRAGLWRYSRHPNYFFEWLHWWTYLPLAMGSPWWWLTLLGPALMLLLLFKVTGIPHTEQQSLASRGEDYRAYQRSTSVFIPWFPKEQSRENRN